MTSNLLRKTPKMELVEWRHGMEIDILILKSINECGGEQKCASIKMGISDSTLSRWIQELNLSSKISQLRKIKGLPPSSRDLRIEDEHGKSVIERAVCSVCNDCGISYGDLQLIDIQGTTGHGDSLVVVVRDERRIKHRFQLDASLA